MLVSLCGVPGVGLGGGEDGEGECEAIAVTGDGYRSKIRFFYERKRDGETYSVETMLPETRVGRLIRVMAPHFLLLGWTEIGSLGWIWLVGLVSCDV